MTKKLLQTGSGQIRAEKMDRTHNLFAPQPTFIQADAVATLIGYSDGQEFLRNRDMLERSHDFPQPLPTCQRPLKWRASQIRAWVSRQGRSKSEMQSRLPRGNTDMLNAARRA